MQETFYTITTEKPVSPFTVALVSDLHGVRHDRVLASLTRQHPTLIALPGDLRHQEYDSFPLDFLSACASLAPTFFSFGNHEKTVTPEDIQTISSTGVTVLDNSWVTYNDFVIGGMTSPYAIHWRKTGKHTGRTLPPESSWLTEFEKQPGFKILLDHHPENYPKLTKYSNIDLILSGHAHGGQIRLFGRGLFAPNQGLFPKYASGVYDNRLVVSRGLANTAPVPRLANPTELVYVTVTPA